MRCARLEKLNERTPRSPGSATASNETPRLRNSTKECRQFSVGVIDPARQGTYHGYGVGTGHLGGRNDDKVRKIGHDIDDRYDHHCQRQSPWKIPVNSALSEAGHSVNLITTHLDGSCNSPTTTLSWVQPLYARRTKYKAMAKPQAVVGWSPANVPLRYSIFPGGWNM